MNAFVPDLASEQEKAGVEIACSRVQVIRRQEMRQDRATGDEQGIWKRGAAAAAAADCDPRNMLVPRLL